MNNNRQNRPASSIRGPRSALTDFLASQNISASRIRADLEARRNAANNQNAATTTTQDTREDEDEDEEVGPSTSTAASRARDRKRKKEAEAIEKIKKSKSFKKRKRDAEDSADDDDLALALFNEKATPVPGQQENCEICGKRFTVTMYSPAGPNGGLVCVKCSKELSKDGPAAKKGKKTTAGAGGGGRRKTQSRILDGLYQLGAKSLMTLCIQTLAKNIDLADDLGDLPPHVIDLIAQRLSKHRLLTSQTLPLFLQPGAEDISIYDAGRLTPDDYIRIFATLPRLKNLKLRNAIQFKDSVMEYLIGRHITLGSLYLHGANLLSETCWGKFLNTKGKNLNSLRVYFTDRHFNDKVVETLKDRCPSLTRLKIYHNQQVSDEGVDHIADLQDLEHLSLQLIKQTSTEPYVRLVQKLGKQLRTFSLRHVYDVDDRLLDALHDHCTSLTKLCITHSEVMTDAGFARLFKDWKNKPLTILNLELCRHVDATKPRENPHLVGLCSNGFRAIMNHSGKHLKKLCVHGCRHISRQAFEEVFSVDKEYPELSKFEISFCEEVTDFIVGCIFRSCPNMKELIIHGCIKVKDVRVPRGKILVGVPNALGMRIEGTDD
ncbi:hypothetical protein F4779DRAFT_574922 [Xylariaceae sp. FL0662B]|nr:hypothetical protein F4779DRAFT_574922 [Xylariaceae sp. FL0662B]